MEFITTDNIKKIITDIEKRKETTFISQGDEENYDFKNKMPENIGTHILDKSTFNDDVKSIGNIAQELLKGI
jgi:hypothetical protein